MTAAQARSILGLPSGTDEAEIARAFRRAVKAVHPDLPGGDPERFRQVIEAHKLLKSLTVGQFSFPPAAQPAEPPAASRGAWSKPAPTRTLRLKISVCEALFGGERRLEIDAGRSVDVQLPAGLRAGESLRLAEAGEDGRHLFVKIIMNHEPGLSVRGHDVWFEVSVEPSQMIEGAHLEVDTPRGRRAFPAPRTVEFGGLVRLRGEGLPARGPHPVGDLILRVSAGAADESLARRLLRRFSARWAA